MDPVATARPRWGRSVKPSDGVVAEDIESEKAPTVVATVGADEEDSFETA